MAYVLPIPLPESLVTERRVVPKHDFAHTHHTVAFGPGGRGYVHSELFYNYLRYDQGDDTISAQIVTLLSPDFSITRQVWLEDLHRELTHSPKGDHVFNNDLAPIAVTAHGEVVFATRQNRTIVLDAELHERRARFDPLHGEPAGFSDVVAVRDGLVCVRDDERIGVVANPPPFAHGLPAVREVTTAEAIVGERGRLGYRGRFAALDLDRILVTSFVNRSRSGWVDHAEFAYVVIGGDGAEVGRLPLGAADTPYGKAGAHDDSFVAHPGLGSWLVRSDAALHVFDRDGARALRLGLAEDERLAPIVPLTLTAVGPNGELVMFSKKHHLLVISDPVEQIGSIERVLVEVGAVYAAELARLKKAVPYQNGRWFGFEPTTPRAAAKPAKTKKSKPNPEPAIDTPVEAPPAASPAEAVSRSPHDVDTLSVYADSLAATDAELGEYINLHIRLTRMSAGDPDRLDVEERASALFRIHGVRWKSLWNKPNEVCEERLDQFCGLPSHITLDGLPPKLDALDDQLAGLPIQSLMIQGIATRGLERLEGLATLRRVTRLWLKGSSKAKLAKPALAWLAAQGLANLRQLYLSSVTSTGAGVRDVIATMPVLERLNVASGQLSADAIGVLGETPIAARLVHLEIGFNPLGSAVAPFLEKFPALGTLAMQHADLGDDIAAHPLPRIPATKVTIADNPRLGVAGLTWLVKAMPEIRDLAVPSTITAEGIDTLAPIAAQLERLDMSWCEQPARARIAETLLPRTRALRTLLLSGRGEGGLAREILAHTQLTKLELGLVTDDDLAALATAPSLAELSVDAATDAGLQTLAKASLPNLQIFQIKSNRVTEAGLRAVLAAPWPKLERIDLTYAYLRNTGGLRVNRDRPLVLRLFSCEITPGQLAALRHEWGDRLIA